MRLATMPMTPRCQPRPENTSAKSVLRHRLTIADFVNQLDDLCFGILAFLIQIVEFRRELKRLFFARREEHLDHIGSIRHSSGGIDARRDTESDLSRSWTLAFVESGDSQQRPKARIPNGMETFEPPLHDDAVFSQEAVPHPRRWPRQSFSAMIPIFPYPFRRPFESAHQCLDQLECYSGSAKVLFRIGAIPAIGVDNRKGRGQLAVRQMVIRHDHIDAQPRACSTTAFARMPVSTLITRRDAFRCRAVDYLRPHSVAIPHPMRYEELRRCSRKIQRFLQDMTMEVVPSTS